MNAYERFASIAFAAMALCITEQKALDRAERELSETYPAEEIKAARATVEQKINAWREVHAA